jgi:hypothetical protein
MSDPLEQELHDMSSAEEHLALRWVLDHHPDVFASAARVVRKVRASDARKNQEPTR